MAKRERNDNNYAVTYYRFSSASQNELSIDMQREERLKMAERRGLKVLREFEDLAKSAWKDGGVNRPGFRAMLRAVEELKPAYVILYSSDRFARSFYQGIADDGVILEAGEDADIHGQQHPGDGWPDTSDIARLPLLREREELGRRIPENQRRHGVAREIGPLRGKADTGIHGQEGRAVQGGQQDGPSGAEDVRRLRGGKSMAAICREVNAEGWRTEQNKEFTVTGMAKILKNEAYRGVYSFAGSRREGGMPQLVSDELFKQVQDRLAQNIN